MNNFIPTNNICNYGSLENYKANQISCCRVYSDTMLQSCRKELFVSYVNYNLMQLVTKPKEEVSAKTLGEGSTRITPLHSDCDLG